jgi:hydroxymethylglutaryl-CoA reductase
MKILEAKEEILKMANEQDPILLSLGGGAKDLDAKIIETSTGPMVITELHVDCKDAMGANIVNTMAEAVAPQIERLTQNGTCLRIISNLATKRMVRAWTIVAKDEVGGEEVVDGILEANAFAEADIYRAATHNKGALNGIIALAIATANDHRAIEAAAHAFAAKSGRYSPLTIWKKNADGDLEGLIELPMAVGVVGGATGVHPLARIALKILDVRTGRELGEVLAAVGLAQNLAALRALVHDGIQKGHMSLHARNIAITAGATKDLVDWVVERMISEHKIRLDRAKELIEEHKKQNP